jgi:hypothetical protein
MKRWILVVLIALALAAVVVIVGFNQIKLDALQEPGHLETFLATQVKHLLVRRSSRHPGASSVGSQTESGRTDARIQKDRPDNLSSGGRRGCVH